jgi:malate-CoA ligase subunit alpha
MEAANAGIRLVVTITDGIPAQDMMMVKRYLFRFPKERRTTMIGPNCAGVISAGKAMLGIMPGHIYSRGPVGLVTRSGTLGYEAASQMNALGIGQTTSVGIGGDPINGSSFVDMLKLFEEDPETEAVVMIGEIGGPQEAEASLFVKENMTKPVIGYVAGLTAPKGRRMGHAGAIISAFGDTAAEKAEIMRSAGLIVAPSPAELGTTVAAALAKKPSKADRRGHPPAPRSGGAGAHPRVRRPAQHRRSPARGRRIARSPQDRRRAALHRHRQADRRRALGGAVARADSRQLRCGLQSHRH